MVKVRLRPRDDYSTNSGTGLAGPLASAFERKPSLVYEAVATMFAALVEREIVTAEAAVTLLNASLPDHRRAQCEWEIVPQTKAEGLLV